MPQNPGWAWIDKPAAEVEAQEFRAFKQGIDAGVDFVMTEHIAVPSVTDGSELPASVEKKLVTDWLKGRLGFRGVVTSDDLWYDHVVARFGAEEVAVRAFEAGHDVILKPKDPVATIAALAAAVRSGRIPESRVDEAARKVLTLKARLGLYKYRFVDEARVGESVGTAAHQALVQEVADRSLDDAQERRGRSARGGRPRRRSSTSASRKPSMIPDRRSWRPSSPRPSPGCGASRCGPDLDPAYYETVWKAVGESDLVVLSLFVARNRMGDAAPLREATWPSSRRSSRRSRRPSWPCPTAIPSSSGRSRRSRRSWSATASGAGSGTRRSISTRSSRRSRASLKPAGRLPVRVSDAYPIGAGI